MLRVSQKPNTRIDPRKRHSLIIDLKNISVESLSLSSKNRKPSSESMNINNSITAAALSTLKQMSQQGRSNVNKRHSTYLDESVAKEYQLALQHLTGTDMHLDPVADKSPTESYSHVSIQTSTSNGSSLFSTNSELSVREFLYEEFEEKQDDDNIKKNIGDGCITPINDGKALFMVNDGSNTFNWVSVDDDIPELYSSESSSQHQSPHYNRTSLDFTSF